MNWRNMVVLYNLTVSHTLFRSVWSHTEGVSTHSEGGRVGGMIDGRPQPFVCSFQRQVKTFWCKQPWRTAGRCTQKHLFLTRALLGQNTDKCRVRLHCSQLWTVIWNIQGRGVPRFISPDVFLPWMALMSPDPHLIKSIALSTQRCHHYIKEYGRPVWWKTHTEPFYLGHRPPFLPHIQQNLWNLASDCFA